MRFAPRRVAVVVMAIAIAGCSRVESPDGSDDVYVGAEPTTAEMAQPKRQAPPAPKNQFVVSVPPNSRPGHNVELTVQSGEALPPGELHVVAVTRDLSLFQHIDPPLNSKSVTAPLQLAPRDAEYVVFTIYDATRPGATTLERHLIRVGNPSANLVPLQPKSIAMTGDYEVALISPAQIKAGEWATLSFEVRRRGQPVTDLRHAGALGHVAIIREGADEFVIGHWTEGEATGGVRAGRHVAAAPSDIDANSAHPDDEGPTVTAHAMFTKPGRYKVWGEFGTGSKRIVADFVVAVQ